MKKNLLTIGAVGLGALVLGTGIGASATQPPPAAEPEVITKTVTETEYVEVTPEVCLTAFDQVGDMVLEMSTVVEKVGPALEAAAMWDVAALEAFTSGIEASNGRMEAMSPGAKADIEECKSLAK